MQKSYINDGWIARNSNNISNLCFCMLHCIIPEFMIMDCLFSHIFRADTTYECRANRFLHFTHNFIAISKARGKSAKTQMKIWEINFHGFWTSPKCFGHVQSILDLSKSVWTGPKTTLQYNFLLSDTCPKRFELVFKKLDGSKMFWTYRRTRHKGFQNFWLQMAI